MKVLTGKTIYQCEHCNKRLLTKKGMKLHESQFCRVVKQATCKHENIATSWVSIVGEEHRMEPDYDYCTDCFMKFLD